MVSPSTANTQGTTWGRPSALAVARCATRASLTRRRIWAASTSDGPDRPHRAARAVPRRAPAELDQADRPSTLSAVRLEEGEHALVVGPRLAREHPRDLVRQVVIPDADGIGIPERDLHHFRGRPRPHAVQPRETTSGCVAIHRPDLLQPFRVPACAAD